MPLGSGEGRKGGEKGEKRREWSAVWRKLRYDKKAVKGCCVGIGRGLGDIFGVAGGN